MSALVQIDFGAGVKALSRVLRIYERPQNVVRNSFGYFIAGVVFNGIKHGIGKTVGQPYAVTCPNAAVRRHIAFAGVHPVGYRASAEAPFVSDDFRHNAIVCAGPNSAQTVHTSHKRVTAALFNHNFKGFKVNFTKSLLGKEREQALAVIFGIVNHEMFNVRINAHIFSAGNGSRADFARQHAVFGIIFAVSSAERIAVSIGAGRVPAVQAIDRIFFSANAAAQRNSQLGAPSLSKHSSAGISHEFATSAFAARYAGVKAERSVQIDEFFFADAGNCVSFEITVAD